MPYLLTTLFSGAGKSQIPNFKPIQSHFFILLFVILNFGHWSLFDIWDLIFGSSFVR